MRYGVPEIGDRRGAFVTVEGCAVKAAFLAVVLMVLAAATSAQEELGASYHPGPARR